LGIKKPLAYSIIYTVVEGKTKTKTTKTIQQNKEKLQNCNLTKFKKYGIINTVKERKTKSLYKPIVSRKTAKCTKKSRKVW